jgi:uncharacterized protein YndB with AHSA1/START domain
MMKKLAIAAVILLAAVLGYAATQPDTFHIERTVSIKASPDKIFPLIDNPRSFTTWSPFEEPGMKKTFTGPESGKGSTYAWEGKQMGAGSMEIAEANAPNNVVIKLDFIKPMQAHNTATFTLKPHGDSTDVTWALDGSNTFFCKVIHLFISMDSMCGKEFEKGLTKLKMLIEK